MYVYILDRLHAMYVKSKTITPLVYASILQIYLFVLNFIVLIYKSFVIGPLLKEMIQHFLDKRSGKLSPDRNVWIYSAHDTTVANFLNTLGLYNAIPPPFASTVLMELRRNANQQYFVTVSIRTNLKALVNANDPITSLFLFCFRL